MKVLKEYQREAINWFMKLKKGYIVLPPGTGKTLIAAHLIKNFLNTNNGKVLLLVPKKVNSHWLKELKEVGVSEKDFDRIIMINEAKLRAFPETERENLFKDVKFLIIDEAHIIKNIKAQITNIILKAFMYKNIYKLLLSATPIKELQDLYAQVKLLEPSLFGSYREFLTTYFDKVDRGGYFEYVPKWNAKDLIFQKCGYLFFRKEITNQKEKRKSFINIPTPYEYSWEKFVKDVLRKGVEKLKKGEEFNFIEEIRGKFIALFREAALNNHHRLLALYNILKKHKGNEAKIAIYTYFVEDAYQIAEKLKEKGIDCYVITGETPEKEREKILREQKKTLIFTKVFSESVNLHKYDTIIFMTVPSTVKDYEQIAGRIDRIDQQSNILTYYFVLDEFNGRYYSLLKERKSLDGYLKSLMYKMLKEEKRKEKMSFLNYYKKNRKFDIKRYL